MAILYNYQITNFYLKKEIDLDYFLKQKKKDNKVNYNQYLQKLIIDKIKKNEVTKENITANQKEVDERYKSFVKTDYPLEIKKEIKKKLELSSRWNKLIFLKFRNKLEVNIVEINQIIKDKKIDEKDKEKIVAVEKNKKFNIISQNYYNEIKKNYYIKIF